MAGSTPNYGWYLPGGGSTGLYGADETADVDKLNQDLIEIDADLFAVSERAGAIEKFTIPTAPSATPGLVPAGTTAQRDLYWGSPANAAARVTLANKGARWFNTDKGWEEQYFSQFDDASAILRNSSTTFGWKARGRQLVHATTVTPTGGTGADQGNKVVVGAGVSNIALQGIFTDDFDDYEYFIRASASVSATLSFRLMQAAVILAGASDYGRNVITAAGASLTSSYSAGALAVIGNIGTVAGEAHGYVYGPKLGNRTTWEAFCHNASTGDQIRSSGHMTLAGTFDGISFLAGNFAAAEIRVYGLGR